jgi:hypothetical protein
MEYVRIGLQYSILYARRVTQKNWKQKKGPIKYKTAIKLSNRIENKFAVHLLSSVSIKKKKKMLYNKDEIQFCFPIIKFQFHQNWDDKRKTSQINRIRVGGIYHQQTTAFNSSVG